MVKPIVRVHIPKTKMKVVNTSFWKPVGLEITKRIHKRTLAGQDADNRGFKLYSSTTLKQRLRRGRSAIVNLTDTGKMLNSMARGVRARQNGVTIKLSGLSGKKAWYIQNAKRSRIFFALNNKDVSAVKKLIGKWIAKKNK